MRSIGCFFMLVGLLIGCEIDQRPLLAPTDAGIPADASQPLPTLQIDVFSGRSLPLELDFMPDLSPPDPAPVAMWPRSHPVGTLLVDHLGSLWMVIEDGVRAPVSGDDTLANISQDEHDATSMTLEEERCLRTIDDYWGPPNYAWQPVHGPEEDPELYVLDWERRLRHPVTYEALDSYGYYTPWLDYYDGGDDDWTSFANAEPVGIRDGTLVHTEHGFYYVVHNRSFWFNPPGLVSTAGYQPEDALWMRDSRLRELAPASTSFNYDTFDRCPADEGSAP